MYTRAVIILKYIVMIFDGIWIDNDCLTMTMMMIMLVKIINDDAHNIIAIIFNCIGQTHKYYLDPSDELYGNGCHSTIYHLYVYQSNNK